MPNIGDFMKIFFTLVFIMFFNLNTFAVGKGPKFLGCIVESKPEVHFVIDQLDTGIYRSILFVMIPIYRAYLEITDINDNEIEFRQSDDRFNENETAVWEIQRALYNKTSNILILDILYKSQKMTNKFNCFENPNEYEERKDFLTK